MSHVVSGDVESIFQSRGNTLSIVLRVVRVLVLSSSRLGLSSEGESVFKASLCDSSMHSVLPHFLPSSDLGSTSSL